MTSSVTGQWAQISQEAERELIHLLYQGNPTSAELAQTLSALSPDYFYNPQYAHAYLLATNAYAEAGIITKASVINASTQTPSAYNIQAISMFDEAPKKSLATGFDLNTLSKVIVEFHSRRFIQSLLDSAIMDDTSESMSARVMDGLASVSRLNNTQQAQDVSGATVESVIAGSLAGSGTETVIVPTGYEKLDDMFSGGLRGGQLVILAARPGRGKSTLALNIAQNVAFGAGGNVMVFSLEMSAEEITQKILSSESEVPLSVIRGGEIEAGSDAHQRLVSTQQALKTSAGEVIVDDSGSGTVASVAASVKAQMISRPIDMVVVDYIQLMTGSGSSRQEEVSSISRNLKMLARELRIPILALSQLNRNVVGKDGKERTPTASDLRESGSLEQDADIIMFIGPSAQGEDEEEFVSDISVPLIVEKQRGGRTGSVRLSPLLEYSSFRSVPDGDVPDFM